MPGLSHACLGIEARELMLVEETLIATELFLQLHGLCSRLLPSCCIVGSSNCGCCDFFFVSFAIGYFLHTLPEFPVSWQQHFVQVYILPVHEILQSPHGRTMNSCDAFCGEMKLQALFIVYCYFC